MVTKKPTASRATELSSKQVVSRIVTIRGTQVLLDSHLAEMYAVETKALNRAVKRNAGRFPERFCFQLTATELDDLRFQIGTSSETHGGRRYLPYVFTEQGVAMLSAVLHSDIAVKVSVRIIDAFVEMRRLLLNNAHLFQKVEQIEVRQLKHIADSDERFNRIFNALESQGAGPPSQGIFFDGQIFDAYAFVSSLIRQAKQSIILVDNYVDESVFLMLSKRRSSVAAAIYTRKIGKQLELDLQKHNAQYPAIEIKTIARCHDRFLILDRKDLYHLGASLKDLGKQCFAFSRMDSLASEVLDRLLQHPS